MCGISNCNSFPDMGQTNVTRLNEKRVKNILGTAAEIWLIILYQYLNKIFIDLKLWAIKENRYKRWIFLKEIK